MPWGTCALCQSCFAALYQGAVETVAEDMGGDGAQECRQMRTEGEGSFVARTGSELV